MGRQDSTKEKVKVSKSAEVRLLFSPNLTSEEAD